MKGRSAICAGAVLLFVAAAFVIPKSEQSQPSSLRKIGLAGMEKQGPTRSAGISSTGETRTSRSLLGKVLKLPNLDADRLVREYPPRKGHPLRFAQRFAVALSPKTHGEWKVSEGKARWEYRIKAPGAVNLNLRFSRFFLPESARLELWANGELMVRPFTSEDNESHGELWTPVVAGSVIDLRLEVLDAERSMVEADIGSVNRGFRGLSFAAGAQKIGDESPAGDCHIDVVCSAAESGVGTVIDHYRKQIRSAGVYTLNGEDSCSGAAINNVRADGKPYFITADHCGVNVSNASSMVVYWNHENSSCRKPGSDENGEDGDGPIDNFNSGAVLRASYTAADIALVELDDPIAPEHRVYLAGWSRTGEIPEMAIGVHFPRTSEKRISVDFDALRSTWDYSTSTSPEGTHWMIADWDHGSTEGGSSGSPIYDQNGRIVGQLTGGDAACGNDEPDWYGKFSEAWEGGGASISRLQDWLDPDGTEAAEIDGIFYGEAEVTIADVEVNEGDSGTKDLLFTISLSEILEQSVTLTYSTEDETAQGGSDYEAAFDREVVVPAGLTSVSFYVTINGDIESEEHERFRVLLSSPAGAPVNIIRNQAWAVIRNDDFVVPVFVGPALVSGLVGEDLRATLVVENTPTEFSLIDGPKGIGINDRGSLSWLPSVAGDYEVTVRMANEAGEVAETVRFTIASNPLALAVDSTGGMSFSTGGAMPFLLDDSENSLLGHSRAGSGNVDDGEESWLEIAVEGPDYLGFWWKVSSEKGFDFLRFSLDGEVRRSLSGDKDWEYRVVAIPPGRHAVRWTYSKDSNEVAGADRGWVDFVQLASHSKPFLMEPPHVRVGRGTPVDYQFPLYSPHGAFAPIQLSGGLRLNERGELTGTPDSPGRIDFNIDIFQEDQEVCLPAVIEVMADSPPGRAAYPSSGPDWGLAWETSGSGEWISQEDETVDGQAAAAASGVGDSERAALTTWVFGPGTVSFSWRASSEANYDFLSFEVNDRQIESLTGDSGWQEYTGELPYGWHKLTWAYEKDAIDSGQGDTGYLDNLTFSRYTGWVLQSGVGQRTGVTLDLDGDGLGMLHEFATGGTPRGWDPMPVPIFERGSLVLESYKRPGSALHFDAEVSGNLIDWNRSERSIVRDDEEVFRVRDRVGLGESSSRFLRMTVHPLR